ncbi:MAG: TraB/GumN family protein [Bacteroidia bacterium]
MKRIFQLLFLAIVITCSWADAQDTTLLYRISGNGLTQNSWLYGTMHWQDERLTSFGPAVLDAIAQSDVVAVEVILDDDLQAQMGLLKYIFMDTTLSALLPEEDVEKVKALVQEVNPMMGLVVEKLKPIFISTLIMENRMEKSGDHTVDNFFEKYGKAMGKEVTGIETVEEQMQALDAISLEDQAAMLQQQISDMDESDSLSDEMMRIYLSQDMDKLYRFYKEQEDIPLNFDQSLLGDRNKIMAHRMDSLMQSRPTFLAVGALHLPGKEGVLQQLRNAGYSVESVSSPFAAEPTQLPLLNEDE